jgi:hypothetical protein
MQIQKLYHPDRQISQEELAAMVEEHLKGCYIISNTHIFRKHNLRMLWYWRFVGTLQSHVKYMSSGEAVISYDILQAQLIKPLTKVYRIHS